MKRFTILVMLVLAPAAAAQPDSCVDPLESCHVVGPAPALFRDGVVLGDVVYVAAGTTFTVQRSTPGGLVPLAQYGVGGDALGVAVDGDVALVAAGDAGLSVFDVADPARPRLLTRYATAGPAMGVGLAHGVAVVACDYRSIEVLDLTDPAHPVRASHLTGAIVARDAVVGDGVAWVLDWDHELQTIDITDPYAATLIGHLELPGQCLDLEVQAPVAYVACGTAGLTTVSLLDPRRPTVLGRLAGGDVHTVAPAGDRLYLGAERVGIVDVTRPEVPTLIRWLFTGQDCFWVLRVPHGLAVNTLATGPGVLDVDSERGLDPLSVQAIAAIPGRMARAGDLIFGGEQTDFVVRSASDLSEVGRCTGESYLPTQQPLVAGPRVYLPIATAIDPRLLAFDVADPAQPRQVETVHLPVRFRFAAVADSLLFTGDDGDGLAVYTLGDPVGPTLLHRWDGNARNGLAVRGRYVYASGEDGLTVFDVTEPTRPVTLVSEPGYYRIVGMGLACHGLLGFDLDGFAVMDVRDPARPRLAGRVPVSAYDFIGVATDERWIYLSKRGQGVLLVDAADPENLRVSQYYQFEDAVTGLIFGAGGLVAGSYTDAPYPERPTGQLAVLPQPCSPPPVVAIDIRPGNDQNTIACRHAQGTVPVAILTTETFAAELADATSLRFGPGHAAPVSAGPHGLLYQERDVDGDGDVDRVFRFRLDEAAIRCGDTEAWLAGMSVWGREFRAADTIRTIGSGGEAAPVGSGRLAAAPNPFNPSLTVSFDASAAGPAMLGVYDLRGRRVAVLVDREIAAGRLEVIWTGRDDIGRALPSGTYVLRLETRQGRQTQKVQLVR